MSAFGQHDFIHATDASERRNSVPALPVSSEFARLANSSIARDRLPFLVDDAHAGIAGLQSAVLSSPIALLEHRLALESQRAQQLANHAQTLENVLAEERKRAAEQTRELQNAHEGLARWRSTAEAAEKQFVSLKDLYHDERQANNRLSDVETECERLGFENMALQKELMAERIRGEQIEKMFASKCTEYTECRAELTKALHAQKSLVEDSRVASIEFAQCRETAAHFERCVKEQSEATARERASAMEAREALQKLAKMFERSIEDVKAKFELKSGELSGRIDHIADAHRQCACIQDQMRASLHAMTATAAAADETTFQLRGQLVGALCERDSTRRSLAATSADLTAAQQQLSSALIQYKRLCEYAKSLHADAQATLEQQTCAEAACAALRREADDERVLRAYVQAERDATRDQLVEARAQTAAADAEVRRLQEAERAATMRSEQWSAALQHRTDELRASELRCGASERAASSSEHERQRLAALLVMNTKEKFDKIHSLRAATNVHKANAGAWHEMMLRQVEDSIQSHWTHSSQNTFHALLYLCLPTQSVETRIMHARTGKDETL